MRSEIAPITSAASAVTAIVAARWSGPLCTPSLIMIAGDVGAEAEERGVAERDHAAVAEDEVEARRRDRVDDDPARQAEVEVEAEGAQQPRQRERDGEQDGERDEGAGLDRGGAGPRRRHQARAGNRPCGLIASTIAMKT